MKAKKIAALLLAASLAATTVTGCAINKDATVATLNDEDISLGLVNFMIRYVQASSDDMYIQYMGEGYWNKSYGGNDTVLDTWKDNAIEQVHELYTLKDHMSDYNVEISDDEQKKIDDAAKQFMDDNSDEAIDEMGATEDIVKEYLELRLIKSKMYAAIVANADSTVTDEEANMAAYTMIQINYAGHYDSSYQYQAYSDEEKAQFKQQADLLAQTISNGASMEDAAQAVGLTTTTGTYATYVDPSTASDDSEDSTESTESENTESSSSKKKDSVYTTNSIDSAVVDALNSLEEGQTSDMITTDSSYYFVRLDSKTDSDATESNRKTVKGNKDDKYYNGIISDWQDDEKWKVKENQLNKIDIHNYFTTKTESTETESSQTESTVSDDTEFVPVTETTEAVQATETTESEQ